MIALNINVTKINKDRIKKGKFLDLVLFDNKAGKDQYGYDGFISESVSKEEREAGVRGNIIGNWKHLGQSAPASKPQAKPAAPSHADDDDIPF